MLKYFKKQKCRLNSLNEHNHTHHNHHQCSKITTDVQHVARSVEVDCHVEESPDSCQRLSLRSTSSFCDEILLEELTNVDCLLTYNLEAGATTDVGSDDDTSSNGPSIAETGPAVLAVNSILEFDEDLFSYHSRLSTNVTSVINEPNCLSYFVQFMDTKNALPLIKFFLDTENFKNAALAQLRKDQNNKISQQILEEEGKTSYDNREATLNASKNNTDDQIQNKQQQNSSKGGNLQTFGVVNSHCNVVNADVDDTFPICKKEVVNGNNSNVPELKTLCDFTMRKPLTDDEKSQIYAQTNKHIIINNINIIQDKYKTSSQLSLSSMTSNYSEMNEKTAVISLASEEDALAIYKKYLIQDAKQLIQLPINILSKISLIICKWADTDPEGGMENLSKSSAITAGCFLEAQQFVVKKMEMEYFTEFLQSTYYAKYCLELIEGQNLSINDILHSEVTLFYFMEYLEQQQERECLDFWTTAINYRKSYNTPTNSMTNIANNENEAQSDAMIIYEKFFSLKNESKLWSSNKLRAHVEACICTEGRVYHCFDLPLKLAAKYLECKHLKVFLKSSIFANYVNELKSKLQEDLGDVSGGLNTKNIAKIALRQNTRDKTSNRHRKTLSDCTFDKKLTISQHNTLLAAATDLSTSTTTFKQFHLNIDSSQLTNPELLWHRSNSNNLKFGRVNSLGRYERDFITPSDASLGSSKSAHHWSLSLNGTKFKNAMRKLVHLPEDNVQEEIAWQVAEMIVKDVTSVTLGEKGAKQQNG